MNTEQRCRYTADRRLKEPSGCLEQRFLDQIVLRYYLNTGDINNWYCKKKKKRAQRFLRVHLDTV